jgi:cell division protein FtsI/penicillin-binding protein 2
MRFTQNNKTSDKVEKPEFDIFKRTFFALSLSVTAFAVLMLVQIVRWQLIETDKFKTLATQQYIGKQRSASGRGIIYGANGAVLAIDEPSWGIYATLSMEETERRLFFQHKEKFVFEVSNILEIEEDEIAEKITDNFVYFRIMDGVSNDKKRALEEINIFGRGLEGFGLHFEKQERRLYPDGRLASHVLGFIGKNEEGEDVGNYGIEGYYWKDIKGHETYSYEEKDAQGNVILTVEYEPLVSREGKDVVLTIEPAIQAKVEEILKDSVHYHRAKSGTVIVMEPSTGAILAMANYPDFNPNEYWKTTNSEIFRNKAISDVYEYGSVHKPITIAIALEGEKVQEDYICEDNTGFIQVDQERLYTWNRRPSGKLTLSGILERSNNPCTARVALETGLQTYYPQLEKFGIGQFIGIGLEDESNSYLKPFNQWTELDLAVTSFGQSISATPLQLISAISAFANEGVRMRPHIVSKIKEDDDIITYTPNSINRAISEETNEKIVELMKNSVTQGEGQHFFKAEVPNYSIAGKTGTAEIPKQDEAGYYTDRTNTTFVGFAPAEKPKMIMLVKFEEPKSSTYSTTTAVPLWIDIFKAIADDLEIPKK